MNQTDKLPKHIAIIMDGNGRWAKSQGMSRSQGHLAGAKTAIDLTRYASEIGIKIVSLFAFSSENWARPVLEVNFLMKLLIKTLKAQIKSLHQNHVKLVFTGYRDVLPSALQKMMQDTEALTKSNKGLVLNVVFNYGGRWEIIEATKKVTSAVCDGKLPLEDINEETFSNHLCMSYLPDPDLMIRTSGESRISNFFLWQLAYTELYFCQEYWPDFNASSLDKAIEAFQNRERRYGITSEQLSDEEFIDA